MVAKDGTLYYFTSEGTLGAVKITENGHAHYKKLKTGLSSSITANFTVQNAGVSFKQSNGGDVYYLFEDNCKLVGTDIGGNA